MVDEVEICVVGMGRAGKIHAENFAEKIKHAELNALVDPIESICKESGEELDVPYYTDFGDALKKEDFDAVVICTPSFTHASLITDAAHSGKHILCEKPLALNLKDAASSEEAAKRAGVKLQIGYMRRFDKYYAEAKNRVAAKEIGKPLIFRSTARDPSMPSGWAADPALSGGIFCDMLSHDFDAARWLMDKEVRSVYARGSASIYEEVKQKGDLDMVAVTLTFDEEIGLIEGCRKCTYGYDLRTEIVGTEGTITIGNPYDLNLTVGKAGGVIPKEAHWFWERFADAFLEEDKHFIDCIKDGKEPLVSGHDGIKALEIALACGESIKSNRPVSVGGS